MKHCHGLIHSQEPSEFEQDSDIGNASVISDILSSLRQPAESWLERAQSDETKSALRARTEEAQRKEIFGAPSFIAGEELFWGNDRFEEACDFIQRTKLATSSNE